MKFRRITARVIPLFHQSDRPRNTRKKTYSSHFRVFRLFRGSSTSFPLPHSIPRNRGLTSLARLECSKPFPKLFDSRCFATLHADVIIMSIVRLSFRNALSSDLVRSIRRGPRPTRAPTRTPERSRSRGRRTPTRPASATRRRSRRTCRTSVAGKKCRSRPVATCERSSTHPGRTWR